MTRSEYEGGRLAFTKKVLRLALQAREAKFGKIEDGRVMLDFIFRGVFFAAKLWDEGIESRGIEVDPDSRDVAAILRDVEGLLRSTREAEL